MLNILSLFSGIGAFEKALYNRNIPYNLLAYCEKDKSASKSYSLIHNVPESKNLWDVTTVDILDVVDRVDAIFYGFPCQDISAIGKQKGFFDENGKITRSGLFFEAARIIDDYKPKFAIAENVKALTTKRFTEEFKLVLETLEEMGYVNYWAVLNLKDYGSPQKRPRVFIISVRKDIDKGFTFPEPIPLNINLLDILERDIDSKYYLDGANTLFSENDKKMITPDGNIYRYIDSDKIDVFEVGDCADISFPNGYNKGCRVHKGVSPCITITTADRLVVKVKGPRYRKFTPVDVFRLQGFTAEDCRKASEGGVSDPQLYKQAGNSIGVSVLEAIFKSLGEIYEEFKSADVLEVAV